MGAVTANNSESIWDLVDKDAELEKVGTGFTFTEGRYDTGKKLDYLRAVVETALARPDLGPAFREMLGQITAREGI